MTTPGPVARVTLLTQQDCRLCEHATSVLARVSADYQLEVTALSMASDEGRALAAESGVAFAPGILLDGAPFGHGRLSERRLRRALSARILHQTQCDTR